MEGAIIESRERKIWLKLSNFPVYSWDPAPLSKIVKGFGDLILIDDLTRNRSQFMEAVLLVACTLSNDIPLKLKMYIDMYVYIVDITAFGEVVDNSKFRYSPSQARKNRDKSQSSDSFYDSSWNDCEEGDGQEGDIKEDSGLNEKGNAQWGSKS